MDTNLVSMAQSFTGLPMDSLIGGPLNAAATANAAMALTQTKFLLDTCFTKKAEQGKSPSYTPIMVNMELTRGVLTPGAPGKTEEAKIQSVTTTFNLPLLTIVPLNSLAVDKVEVTFEMEVKSSYSEEQKDFHEANSKAETSLDATLAWGPLSVTVKGSASYDSKDSSTHNTHYEKSNSAKYTVNVHAGQLPLPKGVNTIIEAFAQSIQPIMLPSKSGGSGAGPAPEKK